MIRRLSAAALVEGRARLTRYPTVQTYRAASTDQAAEAHAQLMSLEEVGMAMDLSGQGRRAEAAPLLERTVEICTRSMGEESALAQAALHKLAGVLFDDQRFDAAEAALTRGASSTTGATELLLLSKCQLFQGKTSEAVEACSRAVDHCERDEDHTPDTDALGKALRQLGATQLLEGAEDDAETSLLRAARLGSTSADQGKGLATLGAFNLSRADEQSVEEAVDLWNEACTAAPIGASGEGEGVSAKDETGGQEDDEAFTSAANSAAKLARASVLCTAAQGELILERGTATPSERLGEALKIREELLPNGHPATIWTLSLLARCHLVAGEAVSAEGLFRAALDGLENIGGRGMEDGIGGDKVPKIAGIYASYASPIHRYSKAATVRGYSDLLLQWEKREAEGESVARQAEAVESGLLLKPPGGLTMHMLHLDEVY